MDLLEQEKVWCEKILSNPKQYKKWFIAQTKTYLWILENL